MEDTSQNKKELTIPIGTISLKGNLDIPEGARGIVLFAHGSGAADSVLETGTLPEFLTIPALPRYYLIF